MQGHGARTRTGYAPEQIEVSVTTADASLALFAALNIMRAVAYWPQIACVSRDQNGAQAVSLLTWSMFAAANLATAWYGLVHGHHWLVSIVFSMNALSCLIVVAITLWKRMNHTPLHADRAPT